MTGAPRHYSREEIAAIAQSLLTQYPAAALSLHRSDFRWKQTVLPAAWHFRKSLANQLDAALATKSLAQLLVVADAIYEWGFGIRIPAAVRRDALFLPTLRRTLLAFRVAPPGNYATCVFPLDALLGIKGLGIASVSKWICMVDQGLFAIYDSRVSIALLDVGLPCGCRAFPIVGRRPVRGLSAWPADSQVSNDPSRAARSYVDYLHVLAQLRRLHRRHYAARVEMALFMAGEDRWPAAGGRPRPLRRGMWT